MKITLKAVVFLLASAILAFGECPVGNISVRTVILNGETTRDGGLNTGVAVRYTNSTTKTIVGAKFATVWLDVTADYHLMIPGLSSDSKVKSGAEHKDQWQQPREAWGNNGWVIAPHKILYSDGTSWEISPKDTACFGQQLSRTLTPLKEAPALLLVK